MKIQSIFLPMVLMCGTSFAKANTALQYWKTQGYGYLIEVKNDLLKFYDITANSCIRNPIADNEYEGLTASQVLSRDNENNYQLEWFALHPIEVTKLDALPTICAFADKPNQDPITNFDVFWATYANHFPYGEKQNWHWQDRYPIWRSMVSKDTTKEQLADIFSNIINQVRDGHASLSDEKHNEIADIESRLLAYEYRLRQAWVKDEEYPYLWPYISAQYSKWKQIFIEKYALKNRLTTRFDNFHFATMKNNISYLRIDSMMGFTQQNALESWLNAVDETMTEFIPNINKSNGLVLDLRSNGGGVDLVSMQILSYLFAEKTRIGSKATVVDGQLGQQKPIWVTPSKNFNYQGPIVVLTSQETASAAEIMLLGLTARDDTLVIGEPSNGSYSDILPKRLPNGWQLGLSNQVYFDADGVDHEEVGIPVDVFVPYLLPEHLKNNQDPAIDEALIVLACKSDKLPNSALCQS
ncbi:S41 family peptidase (plasmid) [Pseudoalteromonas sp. T1lg65]|uniref:S41 family peptidase n=1 Tax=Pseudoalteromonas sp. T1lg65 TaxID=2077101 RepID=UPI003F78F3DC